MGLGCLVAVGKSRTGEGQFEADGLFVSCLRRHTVSNLLFCLRLLVQYKRLSLDILWR
jgi:hypothetical protein